MRCLLILFTIIALHYKNVVNSKPFNNPRVYPGLKFCDSNPILQNMNKTHIMELEKTIWLQWDLSVLQRMMKMSRQFGKGNDYYISKQFHESTDFTSNLCDNNIKGMIEAMNYIAYPIDSLIPCPTGIKLYGASVDSGKRICDAKTQLTTKDCIVYSLGSNNRFDFEESVLKEFPHCKIHTFDCTSEPPKIPIVNVNFEKICLGARNEIVDGNKQYNTIETLMKKHKHSVINLFKMDIEGYEMEVFDAMLTPPYSPSLPYQLLFETHWWHMSAFTATFHMALFEQLTLAGYRPVDRANNRECFSCNEHTMIRVFC